MILFLGTLTGSPDWEKASASPHPVVAQQDPPCVFDNFVWFKEEDIISEIRKDLPGFNGAIPEDGAESIRKIITALGRMLKGKKLATQVGYKFSTGTEYLYRPEHVFTAEDAALDVCKVVFPNPAVIPEEGLQKTVTSLPGRPYSKIAAREQAELMVLPLYKRYGYLRAVSRMPQGELDGACKNGVVLKMSIEPGSAYAWNSASWTGNKVISTQNLDSFLGMTAGEVANGQKIDAGLASVIKAYGQQGYVGLQMSPAPQFDDAGKRITLNISINEGAQYRMGNLSVTGLSETSATMFRELWRVKTGEVYDATYLSQFLSRLASAGGIPADQVKKIKTSVKPDVKKSSVDVIINFNLTP